MPFIKKHFWNIFFVLFIATIFLNPLGLGTKIKSFLIQMTSTSPSSISENNRVVLNSYNWDLVNTNGETLDFNSVKGKVVIVNFWATWCPPCVAEMPSIEKLYNDYGDKVAFIIIASDKPKKVNPFLQKNGYTMPIYYERSRVLPEFVTNSIPTTYVINKNGEIVISKKGAANWNSDATRKFLDSLL